MSLPSVIFEMDSVVVVHMVMKEGGGGYSDMDYLRHFFMRFCNFSNAQDRAPRYVREANRSADLLANMGHNHGEF